MCASEIESLVHTLGFVIFYFCRPPPLFLIFAQLMLLLEILVVQRFLKREATEPCKLMTLVVVVVMVVMNGDEWYCCCCCCDIDLSSRLDPGKVLWFCRFSFSSSSSSQIEEKKVAFRLNFHATTRPLRLFVFVVLSLFVSVCVRARCIFNVYKNVFMERQQQRHVSRLQKHTHTHTAQSVVLFL